MDDKELIRILARVIRAKEALSTHRCGNRGCPHQHHCEEAKRLYQEWDVADDVAAKALSDAGL